MQLQTPRRRTAGINYLGLGNINQQSMSQYLLIYPEGFCLVPGEYMQQSPNEIPNSSQISQNRNLGFVYVPFGFQVCQIGAPFPLDFNYSAHYIVQQQVQQDAEQAPLIKQDDLFDEMQFSQTARKETKLQEPILDTQQIVSPLFSPPESPFGLRGLFKTPSPIMQTRQRHRPRHPRRRSSSQTKGNYSQNFNRNVFPNMARLIINFVCLKKKSQKHIQKMFPDLSAETIAQYYKYAKKYKNKIKIYISKFRLFDFLGFEAFSPETVNSSLDQAPASQAWRLKRIQDSAEIQFKRITRTLAYYFLEEVAVPAILCSKKMKQELKYNHLLLRRQLISAFSAVRLKP